MIELTYDAIKNDDKDMLEIFRLLHSLGVLDQNEELCQYFQNFCEERFRLLPKDKLILEFAEFLKDIGLWMWNIKMMEILKNSFTISMLNYDEATMCRLIKLIAYNHVKDE